MQRHYLFIVIFQANVIWPEWGPINFFFIGRYFGFWDVAPELDEAVGALRLVVTKSQRPTLAYAPADTAAVRVDSNWSELLTAWLKMGELLSVWLKMS